MPDNKEYTGKQDRLRVDAHDPSEVEYLHQQYPWLSHDKIKKAIKAAGPMRKDIEKYLSSGTK